MLKEQFLGIAIKTFTQVYETKERIVNNLNNSTVFNYARTIKDTALGIVDYQWQRLREQSLHNAKSYSSSTNSGAAAKKPRKSSIKPAKEIGSARADIVHATLRTNNARIVNKTEAINGKTSLAHLVWALGHAERASLHEGISVHDVSALLYRACEIDLYPINISRVVYGNQNLVKQVGQHKRTKTYLLTEEGKKLFDKHFA